TLVITCFAYTASPRPTAPTRSKCRTRPNPQWSWHGRTHRQPCVIPTEQRCLAIPTGAVRSGSFCPFQCSGLRATWQSCRGQWVEGNLGDLLCLLLGVKRTLRVAAFRLLMLFVAGKRILQTLREKKSNRKLIGSVIF